MKRIKRLITAFALVAVLMISALSVFASGCGDDKTEKPIDTSKPMLPTTEYPDEEPEPEDNTPEDPGERVDHIFEAEAAQFNGVSTSSNSSMGGICRAQSYFFDVSFGGCIIIRNITNTSNKYIFEFESSAAYKCTMEVAVASAYTSGWVERELAAMYDIRVNDVTLDTDVVVPAGNADQVKGGNNYTCIQHVEVPITIKEGSNLIVMSVLAGVCNLDYINIKTSAELSGFTEKWWDDDTVTTIDLPTETETGTINFACTEHGKSNTFALPELADDKGYIENGGGSYSFVLEGETYTMNADGTYDFPEGVQIAAEPEPEPEPDPDDEAEDPNAPELPEVVINGKDFFDPDKWTTFTSGDETGAKPVEMNGALKFVHEPARFDFFYVKGENGSYTHLGETASKINNDATKVYGKDYGWELEMSSTGAFDMILFATSGEQSVINATNNGGVFLTVESDKITVKNHYYTTASETVAEGNIGTPLTFDGKTKFTIKFTVQRVSDTLLKFKIAVNGTEVEFTQSSYDLKCSEVGADNYIELTLRANGYGQRLCVVPGGRIVRIYDLTTPETAAAEETV